MHLCHLGEGDQCRSPRVYRPYSQSSVGDIADRWLNLESEGLDSYLGPFFLNQLNYYI